MKTYEALFIVRPDAKDEEVQTIAKEVENLITNDGGAIVRSEIWGKRRLAYEVAKERKGIYLYWRYLATSGVVEETERNLRMLDLVIRFMTVRLDESINPEARPTEIDDASYERAATTAADEEDLFLSRGDAAPAGDDDDEYENPVAEAPGTEN